MSVEENATRQNHVDEQLQIQTKNLDELASLLEQLENRLDPVLREDKSTSDQAENKPAEAIVPLAHRLRQANSDLLRDIRRLRDILSRLEV